MNSINPPIEIAYLIINCYKYTIMHVEQQYVYARYIVYHCCGNIEPNDKQRFSTWNFTTICGNIKMVRRVRAVCKNFARIPLSYMCALTRCDFLRTEYSNIISVNNKLLHEYLFSISH